MKYSEKGGFKYSELYQQWRSAVLGGKMREARQIGEQHTLRFMGREGINNAKKGSYAPA